MTTSYVTQTKLGEWFGLTAIKIGRLLTAQGLKDKSGPTDLAVENGYAKPVTRKDQLTFWVWDAARISVVIDEALAEVETPYIDDLVAEVGEAIEEAERHRVEGSEFMADLIEDQALSGVPLGLVVLIRARLKLAKKTDFGVEEAIVMS